MGLGLPGIRVGQGKLEMVQEVEDGARPGQRPWGWEEGVGHPQ